MTGLLFTLFVGGLLSASILCFMPGWRWLAAFAPVPILGAVGAFASCLGLAFILDYLPDLQEAGGIGILAGYVLGGLCSAWLGGRLAWRLVHRLPMPDYMLRHAVGAARYMIDPRWLA